jgi:group I intron endonuclease
MAGVY